MKMIEEVIEPEYKKVLLEIWEQLKEDIDKQNDNKLLKKDTT